MRGICPKCGYHNIPHGAWMYQKMKCRCDICRAAVRDARRIERAKKKKRLTNVNEEW